MQTSLGASQPLSKNLWEQANCRAKIFRSKPTAEQKSLGICQPQSKNLLEQAKHRAKVFGSKPTTEQKSTMITYV
jgi:hypothetical protein